MTFFSNLEFLSRKVVKQRQTGYSDSRHSLAEAGGFRIGLPDSKNEEEIEWNEK
jgi:hypothetical protein